MKNVQNDNEMYLCNKIQKIYIVVVLEHTFFPAHY